MSWLMIAPMSIIFINVVCHDDVVACDIPWDLATSIGNDHCGQCTGGNYTHIANSDFDCDDNCFGAFRYNNASDICSCRSQPSITCAHSPALHVYQKVAPAFTLQQPQYVYRSSVSDETWSSTQSNGMDQKWSHINVTSLRYRPYFAV
jgi:hypothetical protein